MLRLYGAIGKDKMNSTILSNTALFVIGVGAISAGVDSVKSGNLIPGIISAVIGAVAILIYEHLPSTPQP